MLSNVNLKSNRYFVSGNYGEKGIEEFRNLAKTKNICIANAEAAPSVDDDKAFDNIIATLLKVKRARVIVCFCEGMTARRLMIAMNRAPAARNHFQILARYVYNFRHESKQFGSENEEKYSGEIFVIVTQKCNILLV